MRGWVAGFLVGCEVADLDVVEPDPEGGTDTAGAIADTGDSAEPAESVDCSALPSLPLARPRSLGTFTNGEDFAFDGEGQHVSVDDQGNLMGITLDGVRRVLYPGLGTVAGVHLLADGTLVYADVLNNTIVNLDYATGDYRVIASGLSYPNGLDVGRDGFVYVAETGRGGVRRIDPVTGESTVIALGLSAPNGVSFGVGWDDLYVGSFGGGVVYHLHREADDTWTRPEVRAIAPEATPPVDPCDGVPIGTTCPTSYYAVAGQCVVSELGYDVCETVVDTLACVGLASGDACETDLAGVPLGSICVESPASGELFCPAAPAELVEVCGGRVGGPCAVPSGGTGTCVQTYEGAPLCYETLTDYSAYTEPCEGVELGAGCIVADWAYPVVGSCSDGAPYGIAVNLCLPGNAMGGQFGELDGINVDQCGNIYATAYVAGQVFRWGPAGEGPEIVLDLRSAWIPNLHWGNGVGGWEKDILYLADRDRGTVYPLEVGVEGHGEAYEPAP